MKTVVRLAAVLAMAVGVLTAEARMGGMPGMQPDAGGDNLAHVFGKDLAFTATAHMTTTAGGAGQHEMEMGYAVLGGNVRTEMDMAKMKGMSPSAAANMKQMGMDRTITIHRSAEKMSYMIYPGMKAYAVIMQNGKVEGREVKQPKIERVELGKETVEGHPCIKSKVTITTDEGRKIDTLVWQATDMKKFPIKTETATPQGTHTMLFRDIKMDKPDAKLFNPPTDYTKYNSVQELMMSSMSGMMRGAGAPPAGSDEAPAPQPQPQPQPRKFPGFPKNLRNLIPGNVE